MSIVFIFHRISSSLLSRLHLLFFLLYALDTSKWIFLREVTNYKLRIITKTRLRLREWYDKININISRGKTRRERDTCRIYLSWWFHSVDDYLLFPSPTRITFFFEGWILHDFYHVQQQALPRFIIIHTSLHKDNHFVGLDERQSF